MPTISRIFVKTGIVYFVLSMILGIALKLPFFTSPALVPLFWHMLMVGWITQIIMGVSLWMFPGRPREEGFKAHKKGWLMFFALNSGLVLRIIGEPMLTYSEALLWQIVVVLSAILQLMAGLIYFAEMWPRLLSRKEILKRRKQKRKAR